MTVEINQDVRPAPAQEPSEMDLMLRVVQLADTLRGPSAALADAQEKVEISTRRLNVHIARLQELHDEASQRAERGGNLTPSQCLDEHAVGIVRGQIEQQQRITTACEQARDLAQHACDPLRAELHAAHAALEALRANQFPELQAKIVQARDKHATAVQTAKDLTDAAVQARSEVSVAEAAFAKHDNEKTWSLVRDSRDLAERSELRALQARDRVGAAAQALLAEQVGLDLAIRERAAREVSTDAFFETLTPDLVALVRLEAQADEAMGRLEQHLQRYNMSVNRAVSLGVHCTQIGQDSVTTLLSQCIRASREIRGVPPTGQVNLIPSLSAAGSPARDIARLALHRDGEGQPS